MTEREQLELAAKACGIEIFGFYGEDDVFPLYADIGPEEVVQWNPLHDQADSDRMACKLLISTTIERGYMYCFSGRHSSRVISYKNTDEDVCRAVREARMLVAVEIGKGMKYPYSCIRY